MPRTLRKRRANKNTNSSCTLSPKKDVPQFPVTTPQATSSQIFDHESPAKTPNVTIPDTINTSDIYCNNAEILAVDQTESNDENGANEREILINHKTLSKLNMPEINQSIAEGKLILTEEQKLCLDSYSNKTYARGYWKVLCGKNGAIKVKLKDEHFLYRLTDGNFLPLPKQHDKKVIVEREEGKNNEKKKNKYDGKYIERDKEKLKLNMEAIKNAIADGELSLSAEQKDKLCDLEDGKYTYGTWRHYLSKLKISLKFKYFKKVSIPNDKKVIVEGEEATNNEKKKNKCDEKYTERKKQKNKQNVKLNMEAIKNAIESGELSLSAKQKDKLCDFEDKVYTRGTWRQYLSKLKISLKFKLYFKDVSIPTKKKTKAEKAIARSPVESSRESSILNSINAPDNMDHAQFEAPYLGPEFQTSNVIAVSNVSSTLFFHRKNDFNCKPDQSSLTPSSPNSWQKYFEGDDDLEIDPLDFQ